MYGRKKFSSLSDTLLYNSDTELFRLKGNPKAWNKNIQLTGPFIFVQLDSSEVQSLTSYPEPFAVQEDTVTGRLNQIKGDTLIADFKNGDISRIRIHPNSEVLYHITNENNEPDGAFESSSPKTVLIFENGDMVEAKMGKIRDCFYPSILNWIAGDWKVLSGHRSFVPRNQLSIHNLPFLLFLRIVLLNCQRGLWSLWKV